MKRIIASIALLLAMVANAGPFGYEMGQKIEGEPDDESTDGVLVKDVKNPPDPFTTVRLAYTEKVGLCRIHAFVGESILSQEYGDALEVFLRLFYQLQRKYGEPEVHGIPMPRNVDKKTVWRSNADSIKEIRLMMIMEQVTLTYVFSNEEQCVEEATNTDSLDPIQQLL